ncbi:MAG: RDD family protein [Fibrobacter sp.]|nr:RDD family protein [Fibrobacter sp.]
MTKYVGFWARVLATLIDSVLIMAITLPPLLAIYGLAYLENNEAVSGLADILISNILPMILVILFWTKKQATPGKMAVSARIVDAETGSKPSKKQCVGRYFAYILSAIPLGLGFLWVAFDPKKQAWHDKLAGTVVVKVSRSPKA